MTATADSGTPSSSLSHDPASGESTANMAAAGEEPAAEAAHLRAQVQALRAALAETTLQRDQLASSLTLAHTVVERMSDAAYWAQADGRLMYVNEAACRELGYTRAELLSLSVIDVVPGYTLDLWKVHWAELEQTGTLRFDGLHRRKDGTTFPVEISTNLIQAGSTRYACGIVRNMSARVEAERALADSEGKFAAAFGLSPIAMSLTRLDTGEIIDVNAAFEAITGFKCRI